MGETAAKLRLAFDETAKRRGVYLFDEFDAVGGHRGASNDVAEMRRVIKAYLRPMRHPNLVWKRIVDAGRNLSQSELARAAEKAVKTAILDERNLLTTGDVVGALDERREMREAFSGARAST